MASKKLVKQVAELAQMIRGIKLTELSALQATSNQKILSELQKRAGELAKSVATGSNANVMLEKHDELVQSVDTAGITGLISNDELTEYYKLLDAIWAEIEKG